MSETLMEMFLVMMNLQYQEELGLVVKKLLLELT